MQSTFLRNKAILIDTLSGLDRFACAKKHHVAVPTVGAAMRSVLDCLIEHTEIAIQPSVAESYLKTHKDTILRHLAEPMPKVHLTPYAKTVLKARFGNYYARIPKEVAVNWDEVHEKVSSYDKQRDRLSIMQWLCSEGYLVGDFVSDAMTDCFYEAVVEPTKSLHVTKDNLQCQVTAISHDTGCPVYTVQLSAGKHTVTRRFKLELLPY